MTQGNQDGLAHASMPPPALTFRLSLIEVTSVLVVTMRRTRAVSAAGGEDFKGFYRKVLAHNLLLGWWGFPFGLIWTPMALIRNQRALAKLRGLQSSGTAAAGWYSDPSGRHESRYWDGTTWTDQVRDAQISSDPPQAS
jgi:Protein of unknown function (DUF2510)